MGFMNFSTPVDWTVIAVTLQLIRSQRMETLHEVQLFLFCIEEVFEHLWIHQEGRIEQQQIQREAIAVLNEGLIELPDLLGKQMITKNLLTKLLQGTHGVYSKSHRRPHYR